MRKSTSSARAARVQGLVAASLIAAFGAPCPLAQAQPSYAGTYQGSPRQVQVEVSNWGDDCGPRPESHTEPAQRSITVRAKGAHLTLSSPDRTVSTDACWSENPTLRVANATAAGDRWRSECRTPTHEAKRESGAYTLTATSANSLELLEENNYNWQLNESRCIARIVVTQRLQREGTQVAEPEIEKSACTPGPLARIRLRPVEARIAPGERVCFTARGSDAAGCAITPAEGDLSWTLDKPTSARGTLSGPCFKAAASAAEGEGRFQIGVASGGHKATAVVVVATVDLSDITARRTSGRSAREEEDEAEGDGAAFGIQAAMEGSSLGVKIALGIVLLAIVGLVSFVVLRRTRRAEARDSSLITPIPSAPREAKPKKPAQKPSGPQLICPSCRQGYPPGTERCPKDGSTPIPYDEFVRKAKELEVRHCPACGVKLLPGAEFCGSCGAQVRT